MIRLSTQKQPNIIFIMSDDHAAHAISAYDSRINQTPHLDRIANEGMRLDNCFCTNSICAPSRAAILTGKYNHLNGVRTLYEDFDARQHHVAKILQENGYQTAMIGKWHLGHGGNSDPTGFDYWNIFPGQGAYHDPEMIEMGEKKVFPGYATEITTDLSVKWLEKRNKDKPFFMMCHHKAPHRPWDPDEKYMDLYKDVDIPEPETFHDDYDTRSSAALEAQMRVDRDLRKRDVKEDLPEGLTASEAKSWYYQRYIKDYLRCIASIDDNVGRLLDYLDEDGITDDTIVIYTSDQGFFLGDHGWYDKRFMYEESLRMPFLIRYPKEIEPSSVTDAFALNVDFAQTFLDFAGIQAPDDMQGTSLKPILKGETPEDWQTSMYYRYWEHMDPEHNVAAHYGVRTHRFKLICYYGEGFGLPGTQDIKKEIEWELFDLQEDPYELKNVYHDSNYQETIKELKRELYHLKEKVGDID
ncbi:sulfatase [Bacillus sp. J14TS2]|uniref:sulfatase family protein n=1 Tax=Bacillus sp. J14TS2 TaxID=2807188 RepID=UPI001FD4E4B3|nr:sulfatase [Bacillus sp. J14TS2]